MDAVRAARDRADGLRHGHTAASASATTCGSSGRQDPTARGGVLSFAYRDLHPHDLSQVLDQYGVCVRAGHHCAKPLMRRLGVNATARASFALYNDESDVDDAGRRPGRGRSVLRMRWDGILAVTCTASSVRSPHRPRSDALPARRAGADARPGRPLPRDHPRPLPLPPEPGRAESPPAQRVEGFNPLCGDEIVVTLEVDDGVVTDIKIAGSGCSISQSSASLMSAAVKGKPVPEVRDLIRTFKGMMSIHESTLRRQRRRDRRRRRRARRARGRRHRRPGRARRPAGRGQVPGAHQVRHAELEHPGPGARRGTRPSPDLSRRPAPEPRTAQQGVGSKSVSMLVVVLEVADVPGVEPPATVVGG